ncbi:amidohydrolase [Comamonas serinivorans]|uniref:Amidohydrolase n=1 Tax=Comamonas serinivorans TaxID=1082851 RepID=A0A1Y0EJR0_9BURK|nr:M20 aminoacylase family protein [Comamonas serinivorans]ARU03661.1 amidohydrolase [Comamonas serinivorans]
MVTSLAPHPTVQALQAKSADLTAVRRDIHAHPELRYEEVRTADLVAQRLTDWGIPVVRGLGKTGVVGILRRGSSTRAVGIRADMDALPVQEVNTFAHASQNPGRMHACGHDGHTAMLLGAAEHLAKHGDFDGTVYLIFQPAEEGGAGAQAMIDDGLFEQFPMEAVFGMHNWPGYPQGTMAVSAGPVMASSNEFEIILRGKGGHAALPHTTLDPMPVACQLVLALQTIVSRNVKPIDPAVLSVTMIHGGTATNVVPGQVTIEGTVRTFTLDVLDQMEQRMRELVQQLPLAFGCEGELTFKRNYPPTVNSAAEAEFAQGVMRDLIGDAQTLAQEPVMGAEDFAFMLLAKPGAYLFIGNGDGTHRAHGHGAGPCELHNASYDFNDALLPLGAAYWVELAQRWLVQDR